MDPAFQSIDHAFTQTLEKYGKGTSGNSPSLKQMMLQLGG
jgi:hypothetical protein